VVVATFNRAELLKRALKSLILQAEKGWEAVIVDDESTDNTHKLIEPFLGSYPQINYLQKPHGGFREIALGSDFDLYKRTRGKKIPMAEIKTPTYIYHHDNPDSVTNRMYRNVKSP